jgi:hypothetical protein
MLILAIALSMLVAVVVLTTPRTYEDCVLNNIEKANNSQSIAVVMDICRIKFPEDFSEWVNPFK